MTPFKFTDSERARLDEDNPGLPERIEREVSEQGVKADVHRIIQGHRDLFREQSDLPGHDGDNANWANFDLGQVQDRL